jgi:hypothetical protein
MMMEDDGRHRVRAAYRGNYDRLALVKRRYDPTNRFHLNHNITPDLTEWSILRRLRRRIDQPRRVRVWCLRGQCRDDPQHPFRSDLGAAILGALDSGRFTCTRPLSAVSAG